jgi:hypothetical protein
MFEKPPGHCENELETEKKEEGEEGEKKTSISIPLPFATFTPLFSLHPCRLFVSFLL